MRAIDDVPTTLIALGSLGVIWRVRVPEPVLVVAAAVVGVVGWPLMRGA